MRIYFISGGKFGEKILGNLANLETFCTICGNTCDFCRSKYGSYSSDIIGMNVFPENIPEFIDKPETYYPKKVPEADLVIAINIQTDLLSALPNFLNRMRAKALIVPIEDIGWCPKRTQIELESELNEMEIETSFPKPFCSLEESGKEIIDNFITKYRIGKPIFSLSVYGDRVRRIEVVRSSPCGSSWFIAHKLNGLKINELDRIAWKSNRIYPCIASMHIDPDRGEPFLNISGTIVIDAVQSAIQFPNKQDKVLFNYKY